MFIAFRTTNFDDTATRIKKLVAQLDLYWFQENKKEFNKLCSDGDDYYIIDHALYYNEEYQQTLDEEDRHNLIEGVSIDKFCFEPGYSSSKTNGKDLAVKIIAVTKEIANDSGINYDLEDFTSLLADVKIWIDEEANVQIGYSKDEEFTNVIRDIVTKIKWKIDYVFNDKIKALELKYNKGKLSVTKKKDSKVVKTKSYQLLGRTKDVTELYNKLKNDLILSENKLSDFKAIFTHQDISMITPIKWHDDNASELLYFINQLTEKGVIKGYGDKKENGNVIGKRLNYIVLKACFVKSDGKIFTASFKNLLRNISMKLTVEKRDKIDTIAKSFA